MSGALRPIAHAVCAAAALLAAIASPASETNARRITWRYQPIAVELGVGAEQLVHFPAAVSIGLPSSVDAALRTQTVNGTVYWLARAPFSKTRVLVREIDSGYTYLLDVSASDAPSDATPLAVQRDGTAPGNAAAKTGGQSIDYVALTRMAAQALYAPPRLVSPLPGASRTSVDPDEVQLLPERQVSAKPLMAWRADALYLTAVKLTNNGDDAVHLDPRRLQGQWLSATFQHSELAPAGELAASTVVYLISARSFAEAL